MTASDDPFEDLALVAAVASLHWARRTRRETPLWKRPDTRFYPSPEEVDAAALVALVSGSRPRRPTVQACRSLEHCAALAIVSRTFVLAFGGTAAKGVDGRLFPRRRRRRTRPHVPSDDEVREATAAVCRMRAAHEEATVERLRDDERLAL